MNAIFPPSGCHQLTLGSEPLGGGKAGKKTPSHRILALDEKVVNGKSKGCKDFIWSLWKISTQCKKYKVEQRLVISEMEL
jgi:hypothetical protein